MDRPLNLNDENVSRVTLGKRNSISTMLETSTTKRKLQVSEGDLKYSFAMAEANT